MQIKYALAFLALMATPNLVLAGGCSGSHEKQVQSCATGSSYDSATGGCVPVTT